jgi:hypothetical protein
MTTRQELLARGLAAAPPLTPEQRDVIHTAFASGASPPDGETAAPRRSDGPVPNPSCPKGFLPSLLPQLIAARQHDDARPAKRPPACQEVS